VLPHLRTSPIGSCLDPAIPNSSTEVKAMKVLIRDTLVREYVMTVQRAPTQSQRVFWAAARAARAPSRGLNIISDEVDDYFEFTRMGDHSCNDAVEWWVTIGSKRFPAMSTVVTRPFEPFLPLLSTPLLAPDFGY
jgi:hypothetical protein